MDMENTKETGSPQGRSQTVDFSSKEENLQYPGVLDIEPVELAQKLKTHSDQILLIDVRQKEEFSDELGHVPGSSLHVLDQLPVTIKSLPKNKTIVFICRSGGRSARAADFAMGLGYGSVYNLKGGMLLWNEHKLGIEN